MASKEIIEIQNDILDKLVGKIFLLHEETQKRELIFQVFLEVFNSPECQRTIRKIKGLELDSFFSEFLTYGIIDEFLSDPQVEDIMINYLSPIYIHKAKEGLVKTEKRFSSKEEIDLFIKKLVIFSGRKTISKINNVELAGAKGRANIIYSPFGPQITITRAKEKPLSIIELVKSGAMNAEVAAQFWFYVEGLGIKPANLIISGGPGSGKSTLLNALIGFIPTHDRIVVIEDTLELNLNLEENCSRVESDEETSLEDLVKNSLRMRPDRIIVGEVRGREAQDLMTAMNVGKYCMGTMHASTARETIMRLENEPMNVPEVLVNLVDVFVIMRRFNINNRIQRVVGEVVETAGMERNMVLLSPLWSYDFSVNGFRESSVSSVFRDKVALLSGMPAKVVIDEIKIRTRLIKYLLEKNILSFAETTEFFRNYTNRPQETLKELGLKREDVLR